MVGYGDLFREEFARELPSDEKEMRDAAVAALRRQLSNRLDTLLAEGLALTLEEAIEAALAQPSGAASQ